MRTQSEFYILNLKFFDPMDKLVAYVFNRFSGWQGECGD